MASTTIGVTCSHCHQLLGESAHVFSGDGLALFQAHEPVCPVLQEIP